MSATSASVQARGVALIYISHVLEHVRELCHDVVVLRDGVEVLGLILLGVAALLAQLARLAKVPYPIFLVLGGLGLGFVPVLPAVEIPPEVIFVVFLPPLLNSAAFSSSPLDLRAHLRAITLLAVGLVFATTFTVAAVAHFVIGLS